MDSGLAPRGAPRNDDGRGGIAHGIRHTFAASETSGSRSLPQAIDLDCGTFASMKTKKLTEVLERIEAWPPEAQNELADFALELDAEFKDGEYEPTPEELAGIDRGLRAAAEGRFATDQQVEAVFAKFRNEV
jgi:hypothetical protein